jgi:hypothetical protein
MDFGGEMRLTVNGSPLVLRAKFDSEPSSIELDGGANQDGSTFRTGKPKGFMFEPLFQDVPIGTDWDSIMRGGPYNITLVEDFTGRLHTWTAAQFEGTPRVDHHTGETSGVKGRSQTYSRQAA